MSTVSELTNTETPPAESKAILFFWASWHEATISPSGSTYQLFSTLSSVSDAIKFYTVEADNKNNSKLAQTLNVNVVPTFVFLEKGEVVEVVEGADDVAELTQAVSRLQQRGGDGDGGGTAVTADTAAPIGDGDGVDDDNNAASSNQTEEQKFENHLTKLTHSSPVMLFMKGSPSTPKCGFSRQAIEILTSNNVSFGSFDILSNSDVRQKLKEFVDWPTYPMLFVNGELIGGLDIMKEMLEDDETDFAEQLGLSSSSTSTTDDADATAATAEETLEDRLTKLTHQSKVMLFMKGLPSQPKCGFSRQICELLHEQQINFDAFDIFSDEEVRQGLKAFSDWPTFPQLYVDGELVGGLDIVKEMVESDELKDMIQGS